MFELGNDGPSVIVVGVDGSRSSLRARAYAVGLARRQGALLVIVYAQSSPMTSVPAAAAAAIETTQEIGDQLRADMQRLTAEEDRRVRWELRTVVGDAYHALVQVADELRADAVVIGASEQAGHRILGSVAVRLVKAGRWPVTVVP